MQPSPPPPLLDLTEAERVEFFELVDLLIIRILSVETPHILEWAALRGMAARCLAAGLLLTDRMREALFKQPPLADLVAWRRDHPRDE